MDVARLILEFALGVGKIIVEAVESGDHSQLHRPLSDFMPAELKTTLARNKAELDAAKKFG
jgi:hypothetical protein